MSIKLFDSELKIMEILWREGEISAKKIAEITSEQIGWSKTTTYTVIKKCIEKGALERIEPNFICRTLVSKSQAQEYETTELINKLYDGATDMLVASLLGQGKLTNDEIKRLRKLIDGLE